MKCSLLAIALTCIIPGVASAQLPEAADSLFGYEHSTPLDVRDSLIESTDGIKVFDLSYASPRGGRVTAYFVTPDDRDHHAGIVFGHWGPGDRTEFLPEAKLYAQVGIVSIMIDYPWVRPAPYRVSKGQAFTDPQKDRQVYSQAVVDLRRAIDVLISFAHVDTDRIAYVGHSYGAQWGAILSAMDKRMRAAVLMAGAPGDSVFWVESTDPVIVAYRESAKKEDVENYLRNVVMPLAAVNYIPYASPVALLFQFAKKETGISEAAMIRYFEAASDPKSIKWYDTGHELNDLQALIDRSEWLKKRIQVRSLKPIIEKMLK